ncbi:MAG: hypothetical protein IMHGJWDQ_001981 [Candidatus Fervidibacter sp.]
MERERDTDGLMVIGRRNAKSFTQGDLLAVQQFLSVGALPLLALPKAASKKGAWLDELAEATVANLF